MTNSTRALKNHADRKFDVERAERGLLSTIRHAFLNLYFCCDTFLAAKSLSYQIKLRAIFTKC